MSMIIYFDHHIIWVYCFKLCLLQHVGYWLKEHSRPVFLFEIVSVCFVCLFCLFLSGYGVWRMATVLFFFLIFCLHLAFSSIQIEKSFGNCLKRAAKKVRSTTLDWFDLGGRYTYIRVHKNICNQLHTRVKTSKYTILDF